jgi:hypothetical protein
MPTGRVCIAFADGPLAASPTWTRIDDDTGLRVSEISIRQGRQTEFDQTETSTATVLINDRGGVFDPNNASSPYFGDIDGRQISLNLWNPVTSAWVEQYRGVIDDYGYDFGDGSVERVRVRIECVGLFDYLAGVEMLPGSFGQTPPAGSEGVVFYEDGDVQTRLTELATDAGLPAARYSFFTGNVDVQETKYDPGDSVLVAMRDAVDAEFPGIANLYEDRTGRVVFHGRFARFDPDGVSASTDWDFTRWEAGDGDAITLDGTLAQIRPPLQWSRPRRLIYNAAIAYPRYPIKGAPVQTFTDANIPAQIVTDATSITAFGYRGWSARDLLTLQGTTTGNNAADETKLFAAFYVANYALPRTRVEALTFKSIHPDDDRGAATWALICGSDVSDIVNLTHTYPGGDVLSEDFYIEGREMTIRPLNPSYDMVELSLNVSPAAYYTTDVFS